MTTKTESWSIQIGKLEFVIRPHIHECLTIWYDYSPRSGYGIHFFPEKNEYIKRWGLEEIWYDGPHYSFGIGPLAVIVWE